MSIKENIRYLFRKNPALRYNRAKLHWEYFSTFLDVKFGITKTDWIEKIYPQWQSIDRVTRDILKEPEFRLKVDLDAKRYKKASEFRLSYLKP